MFRIALTALVLATPALACEPPAIFHAPFTAQSTSIDPVALRNFVGANTPGVERASIGRGTAAQESLCGGQGSIEIVLRMPADSPYDFTQVGFQFRVAEGEFPDMALPQGPVISVIEPEDTFSHYGIWFEGPPARHKPIKAVLEVFFVAADGTEGPPARIPIVSIPERPKGQKEKGNTR